MPSKVEALLSEENYKKTYPNGDCSDCDYQGNSQNAKSDHPSPKWRILVGPVDPAAEGIWCVKLIELSCSDCISPPFILIDGKLLVQVEQANRWKGDLVAFRGHLKRYFSSHFKGSKQHQRFPKQLFWSSRTHDIELGQPDQAFVFSRQRCVSILETLYTFRWEFVGRWHAISQLQLKDI